MRNLTKALTVVSLLAPVSGYPLGIGDIRVRSALNQNLNAEISLIVSPNENPSSIKVNLAPPERFDSAGVSWSYFLSKIRFKPVVKPNGSVVIKVTSTEALKEPYLNFLLEVSWPKGNLYREFTVLVDPPADYQEPAYRAEPRYDTYYPPQETYSSRPRYAASRPALKRAVRPRYRPANPAGSFGGQITARRNDTLWKVAARAKGGSNVSVEQMMMALYDNNPDAFYQPNVNALSAGKTLKVPAKSEVQERSRPEALAEFGRHNQAWLNHEGVAPSEETRVAKEEPVDNQLKLVAPTESAVSGTEKVAPSSEQGASSAQSSGPGQQQGAATQAKPSAPAVDEAVQGKIEALQKQLEAMQQIIALKDKQLADLQNAGQGQAVEKPPVEQQPAPPPPVEPKPSEQPVPPPPVEPVPPVSTTPAPVVPVEPVKPIPAPSKPAVKPVLTPEPVAKESDSSYLGVIAATVLAFMGILGWIWWRKQKLLAEIDAESMFGNYSMMRNSDLSPSSGLGNDKRPVSAAAGAAGAGAGALVDESSFLNDFKASDFESFETFNVDHGDIDPVAEADVYLAYGRYQQAEDLMKQAVQDSPGRDECKLKLLEIYQVSGNKEAFESYASELAAAGKKEDHDFWEKVIELGKEISSDAEIFVKDYQPAVFSDQPKPAAENILVSPAAEGGQPVENKEGKERLDIGAATFEIDSSLDEESTFASSLYQPSNHQEKEEPDPVPPKVPGGDKDQALAGDDAQDLLDDGNAVDFDLGPYPGGKQGNSPDTAPKENSALFSGPAIDIPSDDAIAKHELDSYEFDFDFEKPDLSKTGRSEATHAKDAWDPDQTIDFSFDGEKAEDNSASPSLDFNFDLDAPPENSSNSASSKKSEFNLSDLTDMDEVETKLDLAKAYIDMGDSDSAKDIIQQVLDNGTEEQKKMAKLLLQELI